MPHTAQYRLEVVIIIHCSSNIRVVSHKLLPSDHARLHTAHIEGVEELLLHLLRGARACLHFRVSADVEVRDQGGGVDGIQTLPVQQVKDLVYQHE